ncbi:gamma-mobile-trio recombinase GmtY [Pseudomonas viridiflava]|uniref:gamma-mobile-trio recombinase GmtY n=2 Tax=Pseudomonas viridiflava TaxID=33069 RepID=UPI001F11A4DC|nr:gamma-mobile-trio recombinase GmtY [Pseudomonas viridiflava]
MKVLYPATEKSMAFVRKIKTLYRNDSTGKERQLPALLTQDGILISHLRFLADPDYYRKSEEWRTRNIYAIRMLVKYIQANEGVFEKATELLKSFAVAVEYGTIDIDTQRDPSGLYWLTRSAADARTMIGHVTAYTDWLAEQPEFGQPRLNPFSTATSLEERMNWCAYYHKEANVFLAHLRNPDEAARKLKLVRTVRGPDVPMSQKITKRFPEREFHNLLTNGWTRSCSDPNATEHAFIDYKGRAMTILMHYGGLRKSEIFHTYLQDIIIDRKLNEAVVRISHPSLGKAPEEGYTNRQDYLNRRYSMQPRHKYPTSNALHAGWKSPMLTEDYVEVHFCPPEASKDFLYNFIMYLQHQRVDPEPDDDHPYAFTNTHGRPETLKNFNRQHCDAVNRIGLAHKKKLGTTEHGHRHAYGYRMIEKDVKPNIIQKAMHHKNPNSYKVYTQPDADDVRKAFEEAERNGA